jgi:menaquinone-dependent protoporphyrinogen oxidase
MRALVAYGSKMGGTKGLAEWLAEALEAEGVPTDVRPATDVSDLTPYDAVIVGGSLYMFRWHRDAKHLVKRNTKALRAKAVWLFSSGPLDDSASERDIEPSKQVTALMARVGARGHRTFGGRMPADAKGFPASSMARDNAGDWRDRAQVEAWAHEIVQALVAA